MSRKKLKNAPLKEVVFEIFWSSSVDETGFPVDKDFEVALGKFDDLITAEFPVRKRIADSANRTAFQ